MLTLTRRENKGASQTTTQQRLSTNHFTWSHGEADVNIMETDVVQQLVNVVTFTSEVKQKAT